MKDKSNGFAFGGIDEKGKILSEKYNSWENEMSKYLDVKSNGKIDNFGFLYLHSMVNCRWYHLCHWRRIQKVASAWVLQQLFYKKPNISTIKIKVTDMMLLNSIRILMLLALMVYDKTPIVWNCQWL